MEFKSSFPWSFYLLTLIAQAAGISFYAHNLIPLLALFILADLYVLMKFIFKTKYIMDAKQLVARRFLFGDEEIEYATIIEVKPAEVFTTGGFGALYRNTDSFNFYKIVYGGRGKYGLSDRKLKVLLAHPKDKAGFCEELAKRAVNADISFKYVPKPKDGRSKKEKEKEDRLR